MEGMKLGKHDALRKPEIVPYVKSSLQTCKQISGKICGVGSLVCNTDYLLTKICRLASFSKKNHQTPPHHHDKDANLLLHIEAVSCSNCPISLKLPSYKHLGHWWTDHNHAINTDHKQAPESLVLIIKNGLTIIIIHHSCLDITTMMVSKTKICTMI